MAEPVLINNGWISVPWALYTGTGPGSEGIDGALGHGTSGNQATFIIQVRWTDVRQAIYDICGVYSFGPNTGALLRDPPKQHPIFHWLYASRVVSIKPMKFESKKQHPPGPFGEYRYAMLIILFQQPKYSILTDAALDRKFPPVNIGGTLYRQEWQRWVEHNWAPGAETLSREAGLLKWAEGDGTGTPPKPTAGQSFNSPTGQYLSKPDWLFTWRQVPYYGLFSPTTYAPENLIAAYNRVNSFAFFGRPVGTLLLKGWQITMNEAPYPPEEANIIAPGGFNQAGETLWPSLTCDVTIGFSFFDPPHANSAYRGHNLAPHNSGANTAEGTEWYLIDTKGDGTGSRIYGSYDFRKIFARAD